MKKLKNISIKSLSVFLSVALILLSFPLSVFALDVENQLNENDGQMSDGVYEVVERREESVKHFRLSDGSYIAVQYDTAVHTLDENGEWQDIDNSLLKSGNEFATQNARVKFAKNTNASKTVAVKQGNYQFSFGLIDANKQKAAVVTNPEEPEYHSSVTKFEQLSTLTKLISRVRYEDAYSDTDMEYVLVGNHIKENIIVKSQREEGYVYSFELKTNRLSAILNEDGSISLNDSATGVAVFTIPAPFMYDADGNVSDAVHFTLTQNQNQKYIVTVVADADWIDAEERAFPVTIDPTIQYGKDKVSAVHVYSVSPNLNYSEADRLSVSKTSTGSMIAFSKLEAEIVLPDDAILTEATVHFERRSAAETTGAAVAVSQVTSSWNAETVTYATKPAYSSTILDYCLTSTASTEYSWDITALMKQWIDTPSSNYGLAFWITDDSPSPSQIAFYITNNANDAQKPYYQIKYRDTKGIEEYYDYFTSTADGAGIGYVQAFSGNLVFLHDSVSTTDSLLPYTLGLTYNNIFSGQNVSASNALMAEGFTSLVGYGFKLSTDETLIYRNLNGGGSDNYYYIWSDSDGTEHYFRWYDYQPPGESSVTRYFCDEDG